MIILNNGIGKILQYFILIILQFSVFCDIIRPIKRLKLWWKHLLVVRCRLRLILGFRMLIFTALCFLDIDMSGLSRLTVVPTLENTGSSTVVCGLRLIVFLDTHIISWCMMHLIRECFIHSFSGSKLVF